MNGIAFFKLYCEFYILWKELSANNMLSMYYDLPSNTYRQ